MEATEKLISELKRSREAMGFLGERTRFGCTCESAFALGTCTVEVDKWTRSGDWTKETLARIWRQVKIVKTRRRAEHHVEKHELPETFWSEKLKKKARSRSRMCANSARRLLQGISGGGSLPTMERRIHRTV